MAVKTLWQKAYGTLDVSREDKSKGQKLFREFTHQGSLRISPVERIALSPGAVVDFYRRLSLVRTPTGPFIRKQDDRWLKDADFQFVDLNDYGTFFRVLMDLPRFRADSIIFMPLTEGDNPLAPKSHSHLNRRYSDPFLESCGFGPEDQLRLLVEAVHLCGKTAGYFMTPMIDPASAVIYRKPEFFSWKSEIEPGLSRDELVGKVNTVVQREYELTGSYDYEHLKSVLRSEGLYTEDGDRPVSFDFTNEGAMSYFSRIFLSLQNGYTFDFFYLDFPENMDDSLVAHIYKTLRTGSDCKRFTGWAVELHSDRNPPTDPREPVVLVHEKRDTISLDEASIHDWFHQLGRLFEKNRGLNIPVTQGVHLGELKDVGESEFLRRLFLARFSGVKLFRRSLFFKGDVCSLSNRMEDVYHRYKALLENGRLLQVVADEDYAWWIISDRGRLLIPLMALDTVDGKKPGSVRIDYSSITGKNKILSVVDYDFSSAKGSLFLSADNSLVVNDLKPGSFRLFSLQ